MKTILTFLLLLILLWSCSPKDNSHFKEFALNGEIINQNSGTLILKYKPDMIEIIDTAVITRGKFHFRGLIPEPTLAQISAIDGTNNAELYLEPGKMSLILTKNKFKDFEMAGSKTQTEQNQLHLMLEPVNKKLLTINKGIEALNKQIIITKDRDELIKLQQEVKELGNKRPDLKKELDSVYLKFIRENPQSYLTPYYLDVLALNGVIPYDTLKSMFYKLHSTIQNSKTGNKLKEEIRKKDNIIEGAIVPDFNAVDLNSKMIALSQFKNNNVVIIDFWASWCQGCRAAFPHLKTLYKKYNPHGLEIIAFSYKDLNKEAWISAINQDSIDMWYNVATVFQNGDTINKGIIDN
ncbi:MAG: AhpC/TSA family protein, partial [Bacteroidales bacterium]|nr:AhpC/TSA family protein [Bacteroidales bacterium]